MADFLSFNVTLIACYINQLWL